jgi:hypothetical protein
MNGTMVNQVQNRLKVILENLRTIASEGGGMSTSDMIGYEREGFVSVFLADIFSSSYRFGTGEIVDKLGRSSGQVDIVCENSLLPSFSVVQRLSRLYLAEGVASVIEVKSDLAKHWDDIMRKAKAVKELQLDYEDLGAVNVDPENIPFYVVGYSGWRTEKKYNEVIKNGCIDGVLDISTGLFVYKQPNNPTKTYLEKEEKALLSLINCLCYHTTNLFFGNVNLLQYIER